MSGQYISSVANFSRFSIHSKCIWNWQFFPSLSDCRRQQGFLNIIGAAHLGLLKNICNARKMWWYSPKVKAGICLSPYFVGRVLISRNLHPRSTSSGRVLTPALTLMCKEREKWTGEQVNMRFKRELGSCCTLGWHINIAQLLSQRETLRRTSELMFSSRPRREQNSNMSAGGWRTYWCISDGSVTLRAIFSTLQYVHVHTATSL